MRGVHHARHNQLACNVRCAIRVHVQARVRFKNVTLTSSIFNIALNFYH
jgi:hypothetical protein